MIAELERVAAQKNAKPNKIELLKEQKRPKEVYAKLKEYVESGFDSIPADEKSFFLKCFGIFEREATPQQFMMRLRIPGGHLNSLQARVIGECAKEFGEDYIDLTTRQQCELRYLSLESLPRVIERLEAVGITAFQTGVDNFRGIVGDPFDALAFDNVLPSHELLLEIGSLFLDKEEWIASLPRKFNTSITGNYSNRCNVYAHDCCFVLAQQDGVYGYNVYLGGKVGKIAKSADIFVATKEEALLLFASLGDLFKRYGFRDNRNKNRLHFLIESVGMATLREAICENAGVAFRAAGETLTQMDYSEPDQSKILLKDGSFGVHVVVPSGIFSGSAMINAAELSEIYGNSQLRLDVEQNLYILGVKDISALLVEPFFHEYKNRHTPYFNHLIACAGTKHCPFGVIENKYDAIEMATYLSERVPLESARVRMYWSACVKGCGIHGLADIGFEGCKAKVEGVNESGVHILLGGKFSGESLEGYTVIKSAPLRYAKYYVESLVLEYKRLKSEHESFEQFHNRILRNYTPAFIGFMMIFLAYLREKGVVVEIGFERRVITGKNEEYELFEFGRKLYYALAKEEAYTAYERFTNVNKDEKYLDIRERVVGVDESIAALLEAILQTQENRRAVVFSEVTPFVMLYK